MTLRDADIARIAALAGAAVVADAYGKDVVRHSKARLDFATQTDIDAERAIFDVLDAHRPFDGRVGEESGSHGGSGDSRRWLVDPLCGTSNFAANTPLSVVNVALMTSGQVSAAAAADPIAREVFWTDGNVALRRQRDEDSPLVPSPVSRLIDVNCDGPLDRSFVGPQLVADPWLRATFSPRVVSSTLAVAWVAAGRRSAYISDGNFRDNLHFAAGIALCQAAGCVVTTLAGDSLHTNRGLVISSDATTHQEVLRLVGPHLRMVNDEAP